MTDVEKQPLPQGEVSYGDEAPAPTPVVVPQQEVKPVWNWCHLITAVIGNLCCQPFGTIGMVMSMLAYTDHKSKDYARSRSKRKMALGFGIAAIVVGSILTILFFGVMWCMMKKKQEMYGGRHGDMAGWWGQDKSDEWGKHFDRDGME